MTEQVDALGRLARAIAATPVESPLSLRMCEACVDLLGVDGGSFTLAYTDPERVTLCATDEEAAQLEDLQEVFGEGPSYTAYTERTIQTLAVSMAPSTLAGPCLATPSSRQRLGAPSTPSR